ncbi:unnamed protein product [Orchesella dallaii]|uniref:Uncharacterized protein n=1 Tax=Orchesella dallaii TaxID=48710 RepID=A0ABP1R1L0_9HEXA
MVPGFRMLQSSAQREIDKRNQSMQRLEINATDKTAPSFVNPKLYLLQLEINNFGGARARVCSYCDDLKANLYSRNESSVQSMFQKKFDISQYEEPLGRKSRASFINSGTFYMSIAWEAGYSKLKLYVVFLLVVYWIVMNQIRLLTFYFWIAMIISFKVGLGSLRILINSVARETDANNFRKTKLFPSSDTITWIVAKYHELEKRLEEFHNLFGGHLINLCFTSLLPMINICFQLVRLPVTSQQAMSWSISGSATLVAVLISSAVTFFNLCDVSNAMADEVSLSLSAVLRISKNILIHSHLIFKY